MSLEWKPRMSKAQANQLARLKLDEMLEEQEKTIKSDLKAALRARWNDTLEEASEQKRLKTKLKQTKQEMTLANKALIKVRKTQLKELLESEQRVFEKELNSIGLTFYKDRL